MSKINKYLYKLVIQHNDITGEDGWEDLCEYERHERKDAYSELKDYRLSTKNYPSSKYRMVERRVLNTENVEKT